MRNILITKDDGKKFKITVPDDVKITFGPWSPPSTGKGYRYETDKVGTLRIYHKTKDNIIAMFAHVASFRDLSIGFAEEVAKEEGATIWKDDEKGYVRTHSQSVQKEWVEEPKQLEVEVASSKKGKRK